MARIVQGTLFFEVPVSGKYSLVIYNITGKAIIKKAVIAIGRRASTPLRKKLDQGVYSVLLTSRTAHLQSKVIIG